MSGTDHIEQSECDERSGKIHNRIDEHVEAVNQIKGGIAVVAFLFLFCMGGILYHFNYRFSNVEKGLEKIDARMSHVLNPNINKITSR